MKTKIPKFCKSCGSEFIERGARNIAKRLYDLVWDKFDIYTGQDLRAKIEVKDFVCPQWSNRRKGFCDTNYHYGTRLVYENGNLKSVKGLVDQKGDEICD